MSQSSTERVYWTIADLELLPDNGTRYEIIDGELFMTRAPQWSHQRTSVPTGWSLAEINIDSYGIG
jgi:hypothetical protein